MNIEYDDKRDGFAIDLRPEHSNILYFKPEEMRVFLELAQLAVAERFEVSRQMTI